MANRGSLFLRGPFPLPGPEAVGSSLHLLPQADQQLAVTVEDKSRRSGYANKKAEEEHKRTLLLLRSHCFDCRDDLRDRNPGFFLNDEVGKPIRQVCTFGINLDHLGAGFLGDAGDVSRGVDDR
jgi:hypothetical protein